MTNNDMPLKPRLPLTNSTRSKNCGIVVRWNSCGWST